ncbi:MAG: tetratricopeptide repeat protein [Treponema sp.]|nr:tetratricopeptide repeat protein [Treponema sp.]
MAKAGNHLPRIKWYVLLLAICCFSIACNGKEKPPEQMEEPVLIEVTEKVEEIQTPPVAVNQTTDNVSVKVSYQTQRPLSGLSGIGGRVNTKEINPLNYENPDINILKQMGVDQYLISYISGEQYYRSGELDKALVEYNISINSNRDFIEAFISRGNTWLKKKDYVRAIDDYTRAIRLDSGRAELYNYRGYARAERGEISTAIDDFSRAITLNRNYVDALINRSHAYYRVGDFNRTIEDCNRIIVLEPGNAYAWNRRGSAWYRKEDDDRAIKDFSEAIRLKNDYAVAWYNRANALYSKGETEKALADLNRTLAISPSFSEARTLLNQLIQTFPE